MQPCTDKIETADTVCNRAARHYPIEDRYLRAVVGRHRSVKGRTEALDWQARHRLEWSSCSRRRQFFFSQQRKENTGCSKRVRRGRESLVRPFSRIGVGANEPRSLLLAVPGGEDELLVLPMHRSNNFFFYDRSIN